jgi:hypothetical protein
MSIENATVTGWRPVTRQDLIDLIDGGEPLEARFRDFDHQTWREQYLVGFGPRKPDSMGYFEGDISGKGKFLWTQCEIKTQVLRDPKFSDLDNGPIECMIYPDGGYECPQKGILVGMTHKPTNKRNTTGMEYQTLWLYEKDKSYASVSHRWHVMVVDKSPKPEQEKEHEVSVKLNSMIDANGVVGVAIADSAPQAPEPEQTSTGWRSPTVEDLKDGPIACEVRDCGDGEDEWLSATLQNIDSELDYPYRSRHFNWKQCRIKATEPPVKEPASKKYREPTLGDLENGPIDCEVRDYHDESWASRRLFCVHKTRARRFETEFGVLWNQCRIKVTEPASQARYRQVDTGDEGKLVEFLDERTGSFIERTLLRFATRGGCMLPVDQDGCVCVYARIRR